MHAGHFFSLGIDARNVEPSAEERAAERYKNTPEGRRNPWFQAIKQHARWVTNRRNVLYHVPVDVMVKVTAQIPKDALPPVPTWVNELTWRPAA